jgi:hypothetical protein
LAWAPQYFNQFLLDIGPVQHFKGGQATEVIHIDDYKSIFCFKVYSFAVLDANNVFFHGIQ